MYPTSLPRSAALVLAVAAALSAGLPAAAQNRANPAYQGSQPDLVSNVQDGLATGKPKIRHVYLAAPNVLAIVIDAQAIPTQAVEKYVAKPGDTVRDQGVMKVGPTSRPVPRYRRIYRDGKYFGGLLGKNGEFVQPTLVLEGERLDLAWAENPASYALTLPGGGEGGTPLTPTRVSRKSAPLMCEWTQDKEERTARHELYLEFPAPLASPSGKSRLAFVGSDQLGAGLDVTIDDRRLRTEAVHVTLAGYHPRQHEKLAYLSMWLGSGGGVDFSASKQFLVVDDRTGAVVHTGDIKLKQPATPGRETKLFPERETSYATPMSISTMDFSAVTAPGVYRVVVPGVGSSFAFRIDDAVWHDAALLSAHGYFNQRSGIEIGPPYSEYRLPRDMHPADGFVVHEVDPVAFFDPKNFPKTRGDGNPFVRIQRSILEDTSNPNAWGGWHDAADFDRSLVPQDHPRAVHAMLDLYEIDPAYVEGLNLNLPESGNKIPDLIDEALWCTELFRRIQRPDGGVPGSVESVEHPGACSYLEILPTALTPPTPQGNHIYAAAAARMAVVLQKYDADLAAKYRESATRAMQWADKNPQVPNYAERDDLLPAKTHANLAAACMYQMTGAPEWHERFKATFAAAYPAAAQGGKVELHPSYSGPWGIAVYAALPADKVDPALQRQCRDALVARADALVTVTPARPFGLDTTGTGWDSRGERPWELILAHRLTADPKYLAALERMAQVAMGNNPYNASHTWGMGSRHVVTFMLNPNYSGVAFPKGITVYGNFPRQVWGGDSVEKALGDAIYPKWAAWPATESLFNIRMAHLTEYTVGGTMADVLLSRTYLAQVLAKNARK